MDELVERELTVPDGVEEVWRSLTEPDWLGEDAAIELREAGSVQAGDRSGFVEEVVESERLVFWWGSEGEESSRVEIDLVPAVGGTRVRVVETRPLTALAHQLAAGPQLSAVA